jgi:alanine racemase
MEGISPIAAQAPVARCRPTRAVVDLDALAHNLGVARQHAGSQKICGVVKANAYGHGLCEVGRALEACGVDALGVAFVDEGMALRRAGVRVPIWVLGSNLGGCFDALVAHRLTPVLGNLPQALDLAARCRAASLQMGVHVEVDTGMARLGFGADAVESLLAALPQLQPDLRIEGLMSHLSVADLPADPYTLAQFDKFADLRRILRQAQISPACLHVANSAATLDVGASRLGPPPGTDAFVRCGLLLYGMQPMRGVFTDNLRPVMQLHSALVGLRELPPGSAVSYGCTYRTPAGAPSRIATVPIGYADGYRRDFSNRGRVLLRGQRVPVVGTVCMDMCMVDVTSVQEAALGDPVVLLGNQGTETLTAEDLADWAHTISYEIVCGIATRVARDYRRDGQRAA